MSASTEGPGPSRVRSHPHLRATAPPGQAGYGGIAQTRPAQGHRPPFLRSKSAATPKDIGSGTTLPTWAKRRQEKMELPDNWQLLREMIEDAPSLRSIRTHRSSVRPQPIPKSPENGTITGLLSSSPPGMEVDEPAQGIEEVIEEETENTPLIPPSTRPPVPSKLQSTFWPPSAATIAIAKCCIAYFIGSLFTFIPQLAHILSTRTEQDAHGRIRPRPAYSAHMVATIVVYVSDLEAELISFIPPNQQEQCSSPTDTPSSSSCSRRLCAYCQCSRYICSTTSHRVWETTGTGSAKQETGS